MSAKARIIVVDDRVRSRFQEDCPFKGIMDTRGLRCNINTTAQPYCVGLDDSEGCTLAQYDRYVVERVHQTPESTERETPLANAYHDVGEMALSWVDEVGECVFCEMGADDDGRLVHEEECLVGRLATEKP